MVKKSVVLAGLVALSVVMSGCLVRTYELTQRRVDQDLETGNRGFLMGSAPSPADRTMTRTTQVVEFELGRPVKFERRGKLVAGDVSEEQPMAVEQDEDLSYVRDEPAAAEPSDDESYENYQVQKGDTLQKISMKFFGTTKRWYKIYEANKGILKAPDKIYPGQTIRIPALDAAPARPRKLK